MLGKTIIAGLVAVAMPALASAQQQRHDLPVPPDKGWQHADTGIILTAQIDGLQRTALVDSTQVERDVTADFGTAAGPATATIHIFRPSAGGVALWFDRADTQVRDWAAPGATPIGIPHAFAPPGTTIAGALRQVYAAKKGGGRSAALAVIPLGDWLVSVRIGARTADAATLDARLTRIVNAIRWPADRPAPAAPARPIARCAAPLAYTAAKPVAADASKLLLTAAVAGVGRDAAPVAVAVAPGAWCREGDPMPAYAVYRGEGAPPSYTIALGDAGRTIAVDQTISSRIAGKAPVYAVTATDVTGTTNSYPDFDGLPKPQQVFALVGGTTAGSLAP